MVGRRQEGQVTINKSFAIIDRSFATICSRINFLSSDVHCVNHLNIICCTGQGWTFVIYCEE